MGDLPPSPTRRGRLEPLSVSSAKLGPSSIVSPMTAPLPPQSTLAAYPSPMTQSHRASVADLLARTHSTTDDTIYYTPSDRIGRNYTPTAVGLTMGVAVKGAKPRKSSRSKPPTQRRKSATSKLGASESAPGLRSRSTLTDFPQPVSTLLVSPPRRRVNASRSLANLTLESFAADEADGKHVRDTFCL